MKSCDNKLKIKRIKYLFNKIKLTLEVGIMGFIMIFGKIAGRTAELMLVMSAADGDGVDYYDFE